MYVYTLIQSASFSQVQHKVPAGIWAELSLNQTKLNWTELNLPASWARHKSNGWECRRKVALLIEK